MKEIPSATPTVSDDARKRLSEIDQKRLHRWKLTLFFSFGAGVVSALSGLVLGAVSYIDFFKNGETINQIGNWLISGAFPLMMLGAHAFDKINEIKFNRKTL
jgi:hypothetical protein